MRSRVLVPAAVLVAFVTLAGCTAPPPAGGAPTASPEASATPDPDAVPAGDLPIACDALLPESTRDELLGADAGLTPWTAAPGWRQGGMSQCRWVGADAREIRVWVLGDADAAYEEGMIASFGARPAGDRAGACEDDPENELYSCSLVGFAGGYWYDILAATVPAAGGTPADVGARLHSEVAAALGAAGEPLPRWEAPADAAATGSTCEPLDSAAFRTAVGSGVGPVEAFGDLVGSVIFEASRRSGELACSWQPQGTPSAGGAALVTFQGLTGGGWAWDEVVAEREAMGGGAEEVSVPGADAAIAACQPGHCRIDVLVDGTVFGGAFQRDDEQEIAVENVVAAAAAWVAAFERP